MASPRSDVQSVPSLQPRPPREQTSHPQPPNTNHQPASTAPPLLLCQRVSKWYGPVIGVNQVTLELHPARITGLVGANGAGKTTLMRLITGHLRPDLGQVTIRGLD